RLIAAGVIVTFQTLIFLTGNYTFFNLITIALCVFLLDDDVLARWIPERLKRRVKLPAASKFPAVTRAATWTLAGCILLLGVLQVVERFRGRLPAPAQAVLRWTAPFGIVNNYGLFAVMT